MDFEAERQRLTEEYVRSRPDSDDVELHKVEAYLREIQAIKAAEATQRHAHNIATFMEELDGS